MQSRITGGNIKHLQGLSQMRKDSLFYERWESEHEENKAKIKKYKDTSHRILIGLISN